MQAAARQSVDPPSDLEHVRGDSVQRRDPFQLIVGLDVIARLQAALRGMQMR
jgi:hypothetical protein